MNTEVIIILSIVFFSAVSILLGIINWIYLSSTSSKISILEEEIEKKAKEFDAIKKEKSQQASSRADNQGPAEYSGRAASFAGQENPAIEIVRNVRAEFEQPGPSVFSQPFAGQVTTPSGFVKQQAYSPDERETIPVHTPETDARNASGGKGSSAEVLDVVDDTSPTSHPAGLKGNEIEIILYSQSKKDTDFAAAWKKLTEYLYVTPAAHVKINFNNVMFLYEKELQYLEKILNIVSKEHGRTTFINCHPELLPIISSRPTLSHCVRD